MPRDSAGNYSLAPGNPVAGGTIISTTWANPTMDDIANALTDSLSRTGQGGMLVPFTFSDGSVLAPGITFALEPNSGLYRAGTSDVRMSIGAENATRWIDATSQTPGEQLPFEIWNGLAWATVYSRGSPIVLANDQYLGGKDFAGTGEINMIKVNTSDEIEFGNAVANFVGEVNHQSSVNMDNTINLRGRNVANDNWINIVQINASDELLFGAVPANFPGGIVGDVTGDLSGSATTALTVTEAAQPAITSVGILTSLEIVGAGVNILTVSGARSSFTANNEPFSLGAIFGAGGSQVYFGASDASATPSAVISNTAGTAILRAESIGDVVIPAGNLVIGNAGNGIDFDPAGSGAAANLLNDYEKGLWTPAISNLTDFATMNAQFGFYTKIGARVLIDCTFTQLNNGSLSGGSSPFLVGLPFSRNGSSSNQAPLSVGQSSGLTITAGQSLAAAMGTTFVAFYAWNISVGTTPVQVGDEWGPTAGTSVGGNYETDS